MNAHRPQSREVQVAPAQLRALAARFPERYPILLDSTASGAHGRYSILSAMPGAQLVLWGDDRLECRGVVLQQREFLSALDEWWQRERTEIHSASTVPFHGGWMIYLGYELAAHIESGLRLPALAADSLCALAIRVPAALVYDHVEQCCTWVVEAGVAAADAAAALLEVRRALDALPATHADPPELGAVSEQHPAQFKAAVLRAQEYIAQGDIYQANLSRGWQISVDANADSGSLYDRLRIANPAPFAAYASLPTMTVMSSSPERLVRVTSGVVETRPIAGTRARRGTAATDQPETQELLANPKERAEHVMLIDLERNDLGRICAAGSVEVNEFMITESYPHLHHIVSNVRGRLRTGVTPGATLRAVFPGGTITGCPKYRCMQIIGELEGVARGAYTGSLGFLNVDGDMDFNILIRTATLSGGELQFRAGAGIVADSNWQRELAETRSKALGLMRAFV